MLLQMFKNIRGLGKPTLVDVLVEELKPRELSGQVLTEGNPTHLHEFEEMPWDNTRFGDSLVDIDEDHGRAVEFPRGTFKKLFLCSCGREILTSTRALI